MLISCGAITIPGDTTETGAYSPLKLPGLAMWFRADQGITISTGVSQWNDISGNGRNLTQGTGGAQPAFSASGGPGGVPCVTFDGVDDFLIKAGLALAKPAWIMMVAKFNSAFASNSSIVDANGANRARVYRDAAGRLNMLGGSTPLVVSGVTETAWHYNAISFAAALGTHSYKQDNATIASGSEGAVANSLDGLTLAAIGGGSGDWCSCSIAEVIVSTSLPAAADEALVVAYIKARTGL